MALFGQGSPQCGLYIIAGAGRLVKRIFARGGPSVPRSGPRSPAPGTHSTAAPKNGRAGLGDRAETIVFPLPKLPDL